MSAKRAKNDDWWVFYFFADAAMIGLLVFLVVLLAMVGSR